MPFAVDSAFSVEGALQRDIRGTRKSREIDSGRVTRCGVSCWALCALCLTLALDRTAAQNEVLGPPVPHRLDELHPLLVAVPQAELAIGRWNADLTPDILVV